MGAKEIREMGCTGSKEKESAHQRPAARARHQKRTPRRMTSKLSVP